MNDEADFNKREAMMWANLNELLAEFWYYKTHWTEAQLDVIREKF